MRGPHVFKRRWKQPDGTHVESDFWFLCYSRNGKRIKRRTNPPTKSRKAAEEQLVLALAGKSAAPPSILTVADLIETYRIHLEATSPSCLRSRGYWLAWWSERWGSRPAESITPDEVSAAIVDLRAAGCKDGTIGGYLGCLKSAYRRSLKTHPIASLRITLSSPVRTSVWTDDEFGRLVAHLPPWCVPLVQLLRETGLRIGDALRLEWDQVRDGMIWLVQEKTGEELRVPLSDRAAAILDGLKSGGHVSGLVFPSAVGKVRIYRVVLRTIHQAMTRAGIEGRTIHDLRRTLASDLTNAGVPDRQIAALLGQRTTRIVSRYAHAEIETLRDALRKARG